MQSKNPITFQSSDVHDAMGNQLLKWTSITIFLHSSVQKNDLSPAGDNSNRQLFDEF